MINSLSNDFTQDIMMYGSSEPLQESRSTNALCKVSPCNLCAVNANASKIGICICQIVHFFLLAGCTN